MQKLEIVYKNIDELLPYVNNARTHDEMQINQIASSIKEFGFNSPIAIDNDNMILCGHGRLLGAKKLGLKEVPTVCLSHLTPQEKKAYILADNKIALNSGWDFDLLKLEFEDLKSVDFNLSLTGFSDNEINDLFNDIDKKEEKDDNFDGEPPEVAKSQLGDIWILGEHRLMCGDSTSENDVKALMQDEKADMIFTDPPYNVAIGDKNKAINDNRVARGLSRTNSIETNIANDKFKTDEEISEKLWLPAFTNMYQNSKDEVCSRRRNHFWRHDVFLHSCRAHASSVCCVCCDLFFDHEKNQNQTHRRDLFQWFDSIAADSALPFRCGRSDPRIYNRTDQLYKRVCGTCR